MAKKTTLHSQRPVHPVMPVLAWEDVPVICTCADVGRVLQCTPEKVQRMALAGEIPAFRLGPEWRFCREDLKDHIRRMICPKERAV